MWLQSREYFSVCREELRFHNWNLLQKMLWLYLLAQGAYLLLVCPFQNVRRQTVGVLIAFALQTLYAGIVRLLAEKKVPSARAVNGFILFFGVEIMALAMWLGIAAFPDVPALFFPLMLILMTQIYTLPPRNILSLTVGSYFLFLALSLLFKPRMAFVQDIITSSAALITALVSYLTLLRFKIDAFIIRQDLKQMSSVDDMTGLLNKTTLEFSVEDYLHHRAPGEPFAMGVVDLDHFKQINDQYGHSMGDSVLLAFSSLLQRIFLQRDGMLVGRFGGDEFVVLMRNIPSRKEAEARFQELLQKTLERNHFEFPISCSAGVTFSRQDNLSFTQLFLSADRALYAAKAEGKNRVCINEYAASRDDMPLMLIAENLESTRAILHNCFEDSFRILEVADGQEALNMILRYQDGISIILLDTEIQILSCCTILQRLHGIPKMRNCPVVLLSFCRDHSLYETDSLVKSVLSKPVQPSQAIREVSRVFRPVQKNFD